MLHMERHSRNMIIIILLVPWFRQEKLALAYNNRGLLYYLKVEFRQAMQDYTQAMQHNPSLAVAYNNRGLVLYRLSMYTTNNDNDSKQ